MHTLPTRSSDRVKCRFSTNLAAFRHQHVTRPAGGKDVMSF
jgi:hypothetical protein